MWIQYRDRIGTVMVDLEPGSTVSFLDGSAYFSAYNKMVGCYVDFVVDVKDIIEIGRCE